MDNLISCDLRVESSFAALTVDESRDTYQISHLQVLPREKINRQQ